MTRPALAPSHGRRMWVVPADRSLIVAAAAAVLVFLDLAAGGVRTSEVSIGVAVTLLAILAFVRWPGFAMGSILVMVPLQLAILAYLYKHGAPAVVVRDLGYVKDAATLAICVAAVLGRDTAAADRAHLDWIDRFALIYAGIATAYLLLPEAFPGVLGGQPFGVRLNAWRIDCLFVILMFAARRVPVPGSTLRRLRSTVFLVAAVLFAVGIWEEISHSGYNRFMVQTLGVPAYQANILHTSPPPNGDYIIRGAVGSSTVVRVGSLFAAELVLGFFMVLPLAYGIERLTDTARRALPLLGVVAGAVTVVLTQTRSAILSGGVVILLSVWLAVRRRSPGRLRFVVLLVGAAVLLAPFAAQSTARARFASVFESNQNTDNQGHISATTAGIGDVLTHPEGFGLGANPATGVRNHTSNHTNPENAYLQIGTELGDAAMLAFIGMYIAMLVRLRRTARLPGEVGKLAGGSWLAGCGLLVGGIFLPVWINFSVALTFWGLAGFAVGKHLEAEGPEVESGAGHRARVVAAV